MHWPRGPLVYIWVCYMTAYIFCIHIRDAELIEHFLPCGVVSLFAFSLLAIPGYDVQTNHGPFMDHLKHNEHNNAESWFSAIL